MRIFLALAFSLLAVAAAASPTTSKIGLVDMHRALQSTNDGKKIKAELEADFNKKKKELEQKEAELKKMRDEFEKKKAVLSQASLEKKQQEFRDEMMKYQESVNHSQEDIQKKQQDLAKPVVEKMRKMIAQIAKDKGYSLILEKSPSILYSMDGDDLTDLIIQAYDKAK